MSIKQNTSILLLTLKPTQKMEVRVMATSAMVSILHMNQRVDSRNKVSAEVLVFR